ncbi:MAG: glycosyltransferase family 4 protein [Bdellovibrionales bacterium]|nr:glycosyltransferase family 4 protein [Bdellovibrionales bacterium]
MDSRPNRLKDVAARLLARDEKPKLLVVCISNSWGGLEQVAVNDATDVTQSGIEVRMLCLKGSPVYEHIVKAGLIRPVPLAKSPRNTLDFGLKRILEDQVLDGVNLVHTHQTTLLGSLSPWLSKFPHVGLVASRHILNNHSKKNPFHLLVYRRVDALVVMSQALRENVLATHPVSAEKVVLIKLGLDFEKFSPDRVDPTEQRKKWGAEPDTVVIGLVGRIDPAKGQSTFILAGAGTVKHLKSGQKVKFVIVGEETLGSSGGYLSELQALVKQFHLEDHVIFAGYQENIPEVMRAMDIFVMPSRQEAFGLVAIEAMAMECPIIISSGGSASEIVGRQEFGLLMRAEDAFDLQQQMKRLLDFPTVRKQMGKKAREHVRMNYDRELRQIESLELYERILNSRTKARR